MPRLDASFQPVRSKVKGVSSRQPVPARVNPAECPAKRTCSPIWRHLSSSVLILGGSSAPFVLRGATLTDFIIATMLPKSSMGDASMASNTLEMAAKTNFLPASPARLFFLIWASAGTLLLRAGTRSAPFDATGKRRVTATGKHDAAAETDGSMGGGGSYVVSARRPSC